EPSSQMATRRVRTSQTQTTRTTGRWSPTHQRTRAAAQIRRRHHLLDLEQEVTGRVHKGYNWKAERDRAAARANASKEGWPEKVWDWLLVNAWWAPVLGVSSNSALPLNRFCRLKIL